MKKNEDNQLIYGRHPVMDALESGQTIDKIILQQGVRGPFEKEVRQHCKTQGIPMTVIPKEKMNKLYKGNHQGVAAVLSLITYYKLEDIYPMIYERGEVPLVVVLDGVTDVRNFGAIARSAEGAGAHAIIIPIKNSARINAEAIKTSAGALHFIPVCRESSLDNVLDYLQMNGVNVIAAALGAKESLDELDLTGPTAIVMGAEGEGVRPHLMRKSNQQFTIPMKGKTDSYNVSVAAGMILYESLRQRK